MQRALSLAKDALYITSPNPRVGCVIVGPTGEIMGQGHTQMVGGSHAEVMALKDATANGYGAQDSTVYVTLEPCSHTGRTPPCTNALISAGVKRVITSLEDPNPLVSGTGIKALRQAGIQVDVGLMAEQSALLNEGFIKRMKSGLPFVRLKIASTLDGVTALSNGKSQWITGLEARADGHAWRARACAVLTGIGTVLSDNPRLNFRGLHTPRQPKAVIIDAKLETPEISALFNETSREVLIYCATSDTAKRDCLERKGAKVIQIPDKMEPGHVDLKAMLLDLAKRQINEVHIESGAGLNGNFIKEGLVDEFLIYQAPKIIGPGRGWTQWQALENLEDGTHLSFVESKFLGKDLFTRLRPSQD